MTGKKFQTQFSDHGKAICKQLQSSGFLEELTEVATSRLYTEFVSADDVSAIAVKQRQHALQYIINILSGE
jgi:hypothetical protein